MIAERRMGLPCYSSTASINKEVEKQNDMMLVQVMMRHYQTIAQLLGSMQSVMTPPAVKQYFVEVMLASNLLMKKILRNFGHDEVERLVPDPLKKGIPNATPDAKPNGAQPEGAPAGTLGPGPDLAGRPGGTPLQ